MSDAMSFPATVEEFMEQYKIVDREEVYTNGAEMVPIFRMKQWFEHEANHNAEVSKKELIHCKDCKFAHMTVNGECKYCDIWFPDEKTYMPGDYFCASAERIGEAE